MGQAMLLPEANQPDPQEKIIYLHNLVAIANAFGTIDDRKKEYLLVYTRKLGIDNSYLDYILKVASGIILSIPDSISERIEYLERCVEMSLIDARITKEEYQVCIRITEMLLLNSTILEEIISYQEIKIIR